MSDYQDHWVRGRVTRRGYRECDGRYGLIRDELIRRYGQNGAFSVCDIGANNCYFGLRLCEDFPHCNVIAFEYHRFRQRAVLVRRNRSDRLMFLERKVTLADLACLSACSHFDVILALSVLHHLGGSFGEWMSALKALGNLIIAEFAGDDHRVRVLPTGYGVPAEASILGESQSHLDATIRRQLVTIPGRDG